MHHLVAATLAFVVAVTNNFWWNRHWTFGARGGHAGFQAARFFTVSVVAFLFAAAMLELLVSWPAGRDPGAGDLDRRGDAAQLHREQDVELRARASGATERRGWRRWRRSLLACSCRAAAAGGARPRAARLADRAAARATS